MDDKQLINIISNYHITSTVSIQIFCFSKYLLSDGQYEIRDNRILSAGDGRRRQGAHTFHKTGSAGGHGTGWHVDDAQARTRLAQDFIQQARQASSHGWKAFGALEEILTRRGECE